MQVMTCMKESPTGFELASVAFDMDGRVADPHELLQAEDCWFDGSAHDPVTGISLLDRYARFAQARLGKKGGHWAMGTDLSAVRAQYAFFIDAPPWTRSQERDFGTLVALVQKLAPVKLPEMDTTGLIPGRLLHDAVRRAVIVQAAYRALGLSAGDHARAERSSAAAS